MQKNKSLFRKRGFWITLAIIGMLAIGGFYTYPLLAAPAVEEAAEASIQTAVARRGDLIILASGAGEVVPSAEINIGFDESGTLTELFVNVGEQAQVGQVLAHLQTNDTPESIAAALAQAELNYIQAQQDLDEIYENAPMDTAQALIAVEDAQEALDNLLNSDLQQAQAWEALVEAEDAVTDAERAYNITQFTASQADIDAAWAQVVLTEDALERAQENFEPYSSRPEDDLTKANFQAQLSAAQQDYDTAVRDYNAMSGTASEIDQSLAAAELATAQAQLEDARRAWELAKEGPSSGDIALAEAELTTAQTEWEKVKDGPDPQEIELAEAQLENARANLELAREDQAVIELLSPIDGTILSISADVGESLGASTIISLADLNQPLLEVFLDETDLDKVAVGFEVEVLFDAFPDDLFSGHIIEVDPSLYESANVTAVKALVTLDAASFAKPQTLPIGLNASVDVVGGRAENAVLVPVESLRELSPGEFAVFVMEDDEPKLRFVEVGLMDFTSAEIISGLDVGEIVTTGIVDTE